MYFLLLHFREKVEGREVKTLNLPDQGHQGMKVCAGADLDALQLNRTERHLQGY